MLTFLLQCSLPASEARVRALTMGWLADLKEMLMNAHDGSAPKAGSNSASLTLYGKDLQMPVRSGTIGPDVIDVGRLYRDTGCFTYDPGFTSTANCSSKITYIDGDEGRPALSRLSDRSARREVQLHRGLLSAAARRAADARRSTTEFRNTITRHTMVHEQMTRFFTGFRRDAHPMAVMVRHGRRAVGLLPRLHRHQRSRCSA